MADEAHLPRGQAGPRSRPGGGRAKRQVSPGNPTPDRLRDPSLPCRGGKSGRATPDAADHAAREVVLRPGRASMSCASF